VNKKMIIVMAAAGLISFAGAFTFAWFTKPSSGNQSITNGPNQPVQPEYSSEENLPELPNIDTDLSSIRNTSAGNGTVEEVITHKRLKNVVYELQQRIREYDNKLQSLQQREERLQIVQDTLKKDIENLNNLRFELASIVVNIKEQQEKLFRNRVEIDQAEKVNLAKIAATYDKMDALSAGKILTNMCKSQAQNLQAMGIESSLNDAVRILYYMGERSKAKLLAELVASEPELAAILCGKLKQITETN
jgi:flagellar motility protein MotE (MotC chaperone)